MAEIIEAEAVGGAIAVRSRLSWISEAVRSHAREYGGTFATEFMVLASQLLVYKLAAHFLGKTGFSEYAVARRTISLIYPVPVLGVAVALPRYVAHAIGGGNGSRSERYFGAAIWCMGLGLLACVLLMNAFSRMFAYIFFAGKQYANLVLPLSILLVGLVLHTLAYSYFRGCLEMRRANVLQLVNYGIVEDVFSEAKELLRYGIQRLPGDFLQMALLGLPVAFVAHSSGIQRAGSTAFGISILTLVASMFSPLGLVLLPKATRMFAKEATEEINLHVTQIARLTAMFSLSVTVIVFLFAGTFVRVCVGPGFVQIAEIIRVVIWAAVPYGLYFVLRGVVDAFHRNGINTRNLFVAFAVFVLLGGIAWFLENGELSIIVSLVVSLYCLGILTFWETRRIATISGALKKFQA